MSCVDRCGLLKHLRLLTRAACALQKWVNPMQAPVQSRLPSLEDLTCGNTTGVRPKAITRAQLMTATPLQQVHSSPRDCFMHFCCLPAKVPLKKEPRVLGTEKPLAGGRGEEGPFNLDRLLFRELFHCADIAGVERAKGAWRCTAMHASRRSVPTVCRKMIPLCISMLMLCALA